MLEVPSVDLRSFDWTIAFAGVLAASFVRAESTAAFHTLFRRRPRNRCGLFCARNSAKTARRDSAGCRTEASRACSLRPLQGYVI